MRVEAEMRKPHVWRLMRNHVKQKPEKSKKKKPELREYSMIQVDPHANNWLSISAFTGRSGLVADIVCAAAQLRRRIKAAQKRTGSSAEAEYRQSQWITAS